MLKAVEKATYSAANNMLEVKFEAVSVSFHFWYNIKFWKEIYALFSPIILLFW